MQDGSAEGFIENRTFDELIDSVMTRLASCALGVLMARAGGAV